MNLNVYFAQTLPRLLFLASVFFCCFILRSAKQSRGITDSGREEGEPWACSAVIISWITILRTGLESVRNHQGKELWWVECPTHDMQWVLGDGSDPCVICRWHGCQTSWAYVIEDQHMTLMATCHPWKNSCIRHYLVQEPCTVAPRVPLACMTKEFVSSVWRAATSLRPKSQPRI